MPNMPRFIKSFSVTARRFYQQGQPSRTERPSPGIDEKVNDWVKETGNIIISATPARHTVMEKTPDGTIIRKTVQMVTVIYQPEQDFLEAEGEMRRRALVPTPRKEDEEDKPVPMNDEEERRQQEETKTDSNAGGPEGSESFLPADEEEDEF